MKGNGSYASLYYSLYVFAHICLYNAFSLSHTIIVLVCRDNFVLASFMAVRMRALMLGMNHPVRCSDWWGDIAENGLQRMGLPYESWDEEQLLKYRPELNIQKFDM